MLRNNLYTLCQLCGAKNVEPSHFWKEHHTSESSYCHTYIPRVSKATGNLLQFKSRDFYFNSDFNDKNELKKWIKENPSQALDYSIGLLKRRFDEGKLKYAPSQVELRSLCSPNVLWFQKETDYTLSCTRIGLLPRFNYNVTLEDLKINPKRIFSLIVDTREQKPLNFEKLDILSEIKKLDYGDYAAKGITTDVFIERKSLTDFVSTVSGGYDRFVREIKRAARKKHYLVVMVESTIGDALAFNMLPHMSRKIKATPEYVFRQVRTLMQEFNNIQFVFADGRAKSAELIKTIYSMGCDPKTVDLQYLIDKKIL